MVVVGVGVKPTEEIVVVQEEVVFIKMAQKTTMKSSLTETMKNQILV